MLLVAILAILSNQGSLMGMERFAKRHRTLLNELLGTQVAKPLWESTIRQLLSQLDADVFEGLLQQWMAAQPGVTETTPAVFIVQVMSGRAQSLLHHDRLRGSFRTPAVRRIGTGITTVDKWLGLD